MAPRLDPLMPLAIAPGAGDAALGAAMTFKPSVRASMNRSRFVAPGAALLVALVLACGGVAMRNRSFESP
jgi:hypothetical protein